MKRFTAKIVDLMKQENLYASQGGPIILSQIENEYGNVDIHYGPAGKSYINWAASMATSLDTGVPWVMCQQVNAPDPIINTCNGFYCDQFTPNSDNKPKMWTENYSGWVLKSKGFDFPVSTTPHRSFRLLSLAVDTAVRILKEGRMDAIKLEGGSPSRIVAAKAIVEAGIAVIGHVGLTPQAISVLGGFRPQGRNVASAVKVDISILSRMMQLFLYLKTKFAPGVSHIEPGGLSFRDVLNILHNLQGDVVAGDVVELNPQRDTVDGMTAMVAAKLVREMAAKIAK
ncbi:unnamed protein product [Vicia faba]|uniref:Glycoside hydrolase 35 catalytic domain-containing protein n=1 Tax=Vicia faba TaxID=3906 RepID=A0AAV0ZG19_VICFA|nr:unnamed protein product [Vicia faba]CAI8602500.1 unnamed protein product [Vicia faba]